MHLIYCSSQISVRYSHSVAVEDRRLTEVQSTSIDIYCEIVIYELADCICCQVDRQENYCQLFWMRKLKEFISSNAYMV